MPCKSFRPLALLAAVLVAAAVLVTSTPGTLPILAEEGRDGGSELRGLDKRFREIGKQAVRSTVLVKSILREGAVPGAEPGRAGYGSGAIVSADGFILTCAHVIDIASEVEVTLADGRSYPARMLGKCSKQDFAMLKIDAPGELPHFALGSSGGVLVGDFVIAVGHPGGPYPDLRPALSIGRVTGLNRKLPVQMFDRYYDDAIQTDAPIFAGNSGGPLVDLDGKLIGLNGAILLINENSYAVPIDEIAVHLDALKAGEDVAGRDPGPEAWTALQDSFEPEDLAKLFGKIGKRFLGKSGLAKKFRELGDDRTAALLERFSKTLESDRFRETMDKVARMLQGEEVAPEDILRDLGDLFAGRGGAGDGGDGEAEPEATPPSPRPVAPAPRGYLGMTVRSRLDEGGELAGPIVTHVDGGGPAERAGFLPGDVFVAVDGVAGSLDAIGDALEKKGPGERFGFKVVRARVVDGVAIDSEVELEAAIGERPAAEPTRKDGEAEALSPAVPIPASGGRNDTLTGGFADIAAKAAPSVVEIGSPDGGDGVGYGVAVEDGTFVLTGRTVIDALEAAGGAGRGVVGVRRGGRGGPSGLATVVAVNEAYDVALLELRPGGRLKLAPLPYGKSSGLEVGQWVVTAGTGGRPLAVGVVSALDRRVEAREAVPALDLFGLFGDENRGPLRPYARGIQHDSPIDAEKHGAPLVDAEGRLVGVNVANVYRGSSYAAPLDDILAFLPDLKAGRPGPAAPREGFLGIALAPLDAPRLAELGLPHGVEITSVSPGLAADVAGLKAGDVIVSIGGVPAETLDVVRQAIRNTLPGKEIDVTIARGGERLTLRATVGSKP